MAKYKVFISPSDQTRNTYASGNTNEAAVCEKIGAACKKALERCGIETMLVQYEPMSSKCSKSDAFGADLHLPIHTNAFNGSVAGTRIMCYNLSGDGYKASKAIFDALAPLTPGTSENITAHPELYEIKHPNAPAAYIEVDFHDVPAVAEWLIANTELIGETIAKGVCNYFGVAYDPVDGNTTDQPTDAGKWSEDARKWAIKTGLITGVGTTSDGTTDYAWQDKITREQMVIILHRFAVATGLV